MEYRIIEDTYKTEPVHESGRSNIDVYGVKVYAYAQVRTTLGEFELEYTIEDYGSDDPEPDWLSLTLTRHGKTVDVGGGYLDLRELRHSESPAEALIEQAEEIFRDVEREFPVVELSLEKFLQHVKFHGLELKKNKPHAKIGNQLIPVKKLKAKNQQKRMEDFIWNSDFFIWFEELAVSPQVKAAWDEIIKQVCSADTTELDEQIEAAEFDAIVKSLCRFFKKHKIKHVDEAVLATKMCFKS